MKILRYLKKIFYIIPPIPMKVQFEITNACNLACPMCPRKTLGTGEAHMDYQLYLKILDKLGGVARIYLAGWGEPLFYPHIIDAIKEAKNRGHFVSITTNGILLTPEMQKKLIDAKIDQVVFSVDSISDFSGAGHKNEIALKHIIEFSKHNPRPDIALQACNQKNHEHDLFDVINFASRTGINKVEILRLDTRFVPSLNRPTFKEEQTALRKAVNLGRLLGVEVNSIQYSLGSGLYGFLFRKFRHFFHGLNTIMNKPCLKVHDYIYINVKGHATPCCMLPHYSVGDLGLQSLTEVWHNEKFRTFRKNNWKKICGKCDIMNLKYKN
ncbi:radical SAM protein [Candidatus Peregrinibacteria bacterium]|nr:radical SAM protein [Candidatus Peregrinibacteria bacterium]